MRAEPYSTSVFKEIASDTLGCFLEQLEKQRRIIRTKIDKNGDSYWIAAEDYPLYCVLAGIEQESSLLRTGLPGEEVEAKAVDLLNSYIFALSPGEKDAAIRLTRRYVMCRGPFTMHEISQKYAMKAGCIRDAISALVLTGEVIRLKDNETEDYAIYCHRKVYERIKHKTIMMARSDIKPKAPGVYCSFLFNRHQLLDDVLPPDEKLSEVVKKLKGQYFPVSWWEDFIFPARIAKYDPKFLDYLCSTGTMQWVGRTNKNTREAAFFLSRDENDDAAGEQTSAPLIASESSEFTMNEIERELLDALNNRGASFLKDLSKKLGLPASELLAKLERLVWNGIVTNDSFSIARYYVDNDKKNSPWMKYNTYPNMGRWYKTSGCIGGRVVKTLPEYIHEILDRYGIISKDIMDCEKGPFRWSEIYVWLKNNEFSSGIKRGFYVSGLSGIQFARDKDIELIRMQDSPQADESYITLCSCDPANPYKDILAKAHNGTTPLKIAKHQSSAIIFRNGTPVLTVKEYGGSIQPLTDKIEILEKAAASFTAAFHSRKLWTSRKSLFIEYWREAAGEEGTCRIEDSPIYEKLQELGFERGYSGITLWRKSLSSIR